MDLIIETTSDKLCYDTLIEEVTKSVPDNVQKLLKRPRVRQEMKDRCGDKAFLIPSKLKFPIVDPTSDDCKPDCRLLLAAYLRANQWKRKNPSYNEIAKKAKELYNKNKCQLNIGVKLEESVAHGQILELDTVIDILENGLEEQNASKMSDIVMESVKTLLGD